MKAVQGETEIGVSVVTIAELVHGAYRTKTQSQQQRRLEFIERLSSDVPVHPVTLAIARLAGRIEGQQEAIGVQFAFEDLLIGATVLHLGYEVATLNSPRFPENPRSFRDSTLLTRRIRRQTPCVNFSEQLGSGAAQVNHWGVVLFFGPEGACRAVQDGSLDDSSALRSDSSSISAWLRIFATTCLASK